MLGAQQYLQPQQQAVVGTQLSGIGEMITAIMPLIIIMMLMPMLKGIGESSKA